MWKQKENLIKFDISSEYKEDFFSQWAESLKNSWEGNYFECILFIISIKQPHFLKILTLVLFQSEKYYSSVNNSNEVSMFRKQKVKSEKQY